MSQIKKLAGQTAIYGLSSIIGRFLNYLLVPFYTRIFIPAEYGVVSEYYAYVTFLIVFYTYGMETAFFQFSSKTGDKEKVYGNGLSSILLSSFIFSAILIILSSPIASFLGYASHPEYITWFALILAFDALSSLPFARLRQLGKAKAFAGFKILNIIVNIGLNFFFLFFLPDWVKHHPAGMLSSFYDPHIGVGYVFISNLISSGITLLFMLPDFKNIKWPVDKVLLKQMLVYAFPLLIAGFAGMINETLDRAVLKYLVTDKTTALQQLGIYSACYKLSILMTLFVQTYRYAAEPFFFSQQHKDNSKQLYARTMEYFVIMCSVIFLVVMLYLGVIKHFIGEKFYSGLKVVPILLLANLCLGIYLNLSMWYKLTGQTRYGAWFSVYGAIITIIFNFWFIPIMGYTGAAWATFICYASMMVLSYLIGQKIYPIPYNLKKLFIYTGAAILTWIISKFIIRSFSLQEISSGIFNTLLLLVYLATMWKVLNDSDEKNLKASV